MRHRLRGKSAIIGVGTTESWNNPGYSSLDQMALAVSAAASDAGIQVSEIDGLFATTATQLMPALSAAEYLGLRPSVLDGTNIGGSSFIHHLLSAALALDAGLCTYACICYGSNQLTAGGRFATLSEPQQWEAPYEPRHPISGFALAAARHMHEFGTTREQLADVAVAARAWAKLNPVARVRDDLTREDVLTSRMISDPLTLLDCCLVTDGGGAVIMTAADRAGAGQRDPVFLLGAATATTHRQISAMPTLTSTAAVDSGSRAFAMAGVTPGEVDVLQLYDAFTINTVLFLEDLGFCEKGEGGSFIQDGRIAPGGSLPVNTNGGGLSCCHPGMYGIFMIVEAVRQLRCEAAERQVKDAQVALVHGNGVQLASQVTALLGTGATV